MITDKTADIIAAAVGALITLAAASLASKAPTPKAPQEELRSTETPTPMSPSHAEAIKRLDEMEARAARIMRQLKEMEPKKRKGAEPKPDTLQGHTSSTP